MMTQPEIPTVTPTGPGGPVTPASSAAPTGVDQIRGPFKVGDKVQLTDPKGRLNTIELKVGGSFQSHKGYFKHAELIGQPEGTVVTNTEGVQYLAFRPLMADYVLSMPRGAAVIYPKDAGQIVAMADIFPGATVIEAGVGSGGLTLALLRAVGDAGTLHSIERRAEFAQVAQGNVKKFFGGDHPAWHLHIGDFAEVVGQIVAPGSVDRIILDMLAPWENLTEAATALRPGGVFCAYVATTTQLSRLAEDLRASELFGEQTAFETMVRTWHLEGLAVRPDHRMVGHTGFLLIARRLAPGVAPHLRKRRPAPGAGGPHQKPDPDEVDAVNPIILPERSEDGESQLPANPAFADRDFTEEEFGIRPVGERKLRRTIRDLNVSNQQPQLTEAISEDDDDQH